MDIDVRYLARVKGKEFLRLSGPLSLRPVFHRMQFRVHRERPVRLSFGRSIRFLFDCTAEIAGGIGDGANSNASNDDAASPFCQVLAIAAQYPAGSSTFY